MTAPGEPGGDALAALPGVASRQLRWLVGGLGVWATLQAAAPVAVAPVAMALALSGALLALSGPRTLPWLLLGWGASSAVAQAVDVSLTVLLAAWAAAIAIRAAPHAVDGLDPWLAAFAGAGLTGVAAWATSHLPLDAPGRELTAAICVLAASAQALLPAAWRHDHPDRAGLLALRGVPVHLRPDARHALTLAAQAAPLAPDVSTRRGLHEVAWWVVALQRTRAQIGREIDRLGQVSPEPGGQDDAVGHEDPFVRERHRATQAHRERLASYRREQHLELERSAALVRHAIAWLEDARAGLALGRHLASDTDPQDLEDVLARLRRHADVARWTRSSRREVDLVGAVPLPASRGRSHDEADHRADTAAR